MIIVTMVTIMTSQKARRARKPDREKMLAQWVQLSRMQVAQTEHKPQTRDTVKLQLKL